MIIPRIVIPITFKMVIPQNWFFQDHAFLNNDRIDRDGNNYDKKFCLVKDEAVFFLDIRDLSNITKKYLLGFFLPDCWELAPYYFK